MRKNPKLSKGTLFFSIYVNRGVATKNFLGGSNFFSPFSPHGFVLVVNSNVTLFSMFS